MFGETIRVQTLFLFLYVTSLDIHPSRTSFCNLVGLHGNFSQITKAQNCEQKLVIYGTDEIKWN